jgi:hypothetical protein
MGLSDVATSMVPRAVNFDASISRRLRTALDLAIWLVVALIIAFLWNRRCAAGGFKTARSQPFETLRLGKHHPAKSALHLPFGNHLSKPGDNEGSPRDPEIRMASQFQNTL